MGQVGVGHFQTDGSIRLSLQGVSRSLEPVAGQLSNSVATKLTAVEGSMKENISKLLKSKVM